MQFAKILGCQVKARSVGEKREGQKEVWNSLHHIMLKGQFPTINPQLHQIHSSWNKAKQNLRNKKINDAVQTEAALQWGPLLRE